MVEIHTGMAQRQQRVIDEVDLTEADEAILDELHAGARTKKAVVDATGLHRNTVGNRLDVLEAGDVIKCIHDSTALYELVDDPRGREGYVQIGEELDWEKLRPVGPYSAERLEYVLGALESGDELASGLVWKTVVAQTPEGSVTLEEILGALGEAKWLLEWAKDIDE